jgi:heme/copper-type cytochrome/quinol oxidase subunit 2
VAVASPVLHKYDVPPVADKLDVPPETTVEGEADAAAEGKAFTVNCNTLEYASTL